MSRHYDEESQLKAKYQSKQAHAQTPLDKLRAACLARGTKGLSQLGRAFRIFDDDGSHTLEMSEFKKAMHDYGTNMNENEVQQLFEECDRDNSGKIDFDELVDLLRPPMNDMRKGLVMKAFNKLDKSGDGIVTTGDLKGVYDVRKHPKYLNGEMTEDQILKLFLSTFEDKSATKDGQITKDEFLNYYSGVSDSIDDNKNGDAYFQLLMTNAWKL